MEKYYNIAEESVENIVEWLENETWSGARDRINDATDEQKQAVAYFIQEIAESNESPYMDETTINDLVWFECDEIFFPEEYEDEETEESEEDEE